MANVDIGDDSLISTNVAFIGNDHPIDNGDMLIRLHKPADPARITLEGDNLIGYGSTILGDVRVGRGAVVGAGSLVTGDLPPYSISVGSPARVVRYRVRDAGGTV